MPWKRMMRYLGGTLSLQVMIVLSIATSEASEPMRIPDPLSDRAFLYGEWQPNRASVVVFIDPLCPYCKKAIPKLDQVTDYNLFVYWVPVFGQRSEDSIRPFFRCRQPTGRSVLRSLINTESADIIRSTPICEGELNASSRAVNDAMVSSYPINGVPAYFLQGVQVTLPQIQTVVTEPAGYVNGVAIDWRRYKESRVEQSEPSGSLAIILPEQHDSNLYIQLLRQNRPEYLFSINGWVMLCEVLSTAACVNSKAVQRIQSQQYREITVLLGIDNHLDEIYLLSRDGKLSSLHAKSRPVSD